MTNQRLRIDLSDNSILAFGVRLIWLPLPLFALTACKNDSTEVKPRRPVEAPRISFSTEVRPILIENCVSCHTDIPLHDPAGWDVLHAHKEDIQTPELLKKWVEQGRLMDSHWAETPLRKVEGNSIDDFLKSAPEKAEPREAPQAMFTASVVDLLAGDLMPDKMRAVSTGYLRQGDDTPHWRATKVAREFLGLRIECASCHDHPSEKWPHSRYQELADLFTTPYDHLPKALPPLLVKVSEEEAMRIKELKAAVVDASKSAAADDDDYLNWLALDEGVPSLPGLVAAYSFEGGHLHNLAPMGSVKADGKDLTAGDGIHGQGLFFNGLNQLILTELPGSSELDRFTISTWIKLGPEALDDTPIVTIGSRERGFEFRVMGGKLQARWTRFWPQLAMAATSQLPQIAPHRWAHVAVSYDGTRLASGIQIYLNGFPVKMETTATELMKSVLPKNEALVVSGKGLLLDEFQLYADVLTPIGVRQIFDGTSLVKSYQEGGDLRDFYQRHFGKGEKERQARILSLGRKLLKTEDALPAYLVMAEKTETEAEREANSQEPRKFKNRLKFAQSLNKDLLSRSLANEIWRRHFGSPLAHSLGTSDPLPEHADLLEWLAGELKKSDFNITNLGLLIRESKAWTQEWQSLKGKPANCPRPTE